MNGYEFKREIEQIFKVARNMYPIGYLNSWTR